MKTLRYLRITVLGAALCLLGATVIGSGVLAEGSAGIGGRPANPREDNPRSQSIFVYELEPGTQTEDAVEVVNNTDRQKTLLVYAVDSKVASDGAFACAQKTETPVSVGTWIELEKDEVVLEPRSSEQVSFALRVPETASAGEQNGCIVIQDGDSTPASDGSGVTLSFRSAIRVAVTIPGEITKDLAFTGLAATHVDDSKMRLSAGLKNNGNVSLDTDLEVSLKTLFGNAIRADGGQFPVLARSEAAFNFTVDQPFWGGWYVLEAAAGYNPDVSASIGEGGTDKEMIHSEKVYMFVKPQPLALAIQLAAVLVVIGSAGTLFMRRRHHKKLHARSRTFVVKDGASIQAIAKKAGVPWKTIARLNKLKAPYHIEPGQKLKIPTPQDKQTRSSKKRPADSSTNE